MSDPDALGIDFERLVTRLLERMGFRAEMTKATGDGGIDIVATLDHPVTGGRFLIQCKRYAPSSPVGAATVREFYGAVTADQRALKGILITTSGFTAQALEFARTLPIELIGGDKLRRLLEQHGLRSDALGLDSTPEPTTPQPKDRASELLDLIMNSDRGSGRRLTLCKELTQLQPADPWAWVHLGTSYYFCHLYDDQVKALREAVRLKPGFCEAWHWLGRGLHRAGDLDAAADALQKALAIQPDNFHALGDQGMVYLEKGDKERALLALERAVKIKPENAHAWWRLGFCRRLSGKKDEALSALRESLRLDPNYSASWRELCLVYDQMGERVRMLDAFRRLKQLDPAAARELRRDFPESFQG
jgi:tetratricopeptide (TPR) repeat protein